jgi:hypothetical protein
MWKKANTCLLNNTRQAHDKRIPPRVPKLTGTRHQSSERRLESHNLGTHGQRSNSTHHRSASDIDGTRNSFKTHHQTSQRTRCFHPLFEVCMHGQRSNSTHHRSGASSDIDGTRNSFETEDDHQTSQRTRCFHPFEVWQSTRSESERGARIGWRGSHSAHKSSLRPYLHPISPVAMPKYVCLFVCLFVFIEGSARSAHDILVR